jgi:nitrogen fixation/metabolism regulation signal transduction histidine kinase
MPQQSKSFHRKHYFIDRKFQVRYMMTFFIPMVIMLAFMLAALYFAAISIVDGTNRIIRRDIENTITLELQDQAEPSVDRYKAIVNDITRNIKEFSQNKKVKQKMLTTLLWVFGAGIFIVIIQIVFMTVFFSHKIAGPVYRIETVCHNMIEGKYTDQIKLRKGDELQNLAGLMNCVISMTSQRIHDLLHAENDDKRREIGSKLEL